MDLQTFDGGQGYLKAGFLGFPGSGKTFTSTLLACAVREHFGLKEPIAFFDTEAGAAYVNPMAKALTGKSIIGLRSRAFGDLVEMAQKCSAGAASALVVDSITHVWREVTDAYLQEVNTIRSSQGKSKRTRLEFQDWAVIKAKWGEWPDLFLNSALHIIICGRAGYDWDFEEREDATGQVRKELVKTGIKMKVESEFGFEPSLLIDMRRDSKFNRETSEQEELVHRAVVLKDRTAILDGAECVFAAARNAKGGLDYAAMFDAVKRFFLPHLNQLTAGASNTVDTTPKTQMGVDGAGDVEWQREKRARTVLQEEIEGLLTATWAGRGKEEVKAKADALMAAFNTRSWTKVCALSAAELRSGMERLNEHIASTTTKEVK